MNGIGNIMEKQTNVLTHKEIEKRSKLQKEKPLVYNKVIQYDNKLNAGESIAIIQFQYDYTCNFNCRHCSISDFRKKSGGRSFEISDVKRLSYEADNMGLGHIDLTGGEPLAFKDLGNVIDAIDPNKFYLQVDTNGWLMNHKNAAWLKSVGVDKIQLSIDSLDETSHDDFRKKTGSHKHCLNAIYAIKDAGLNLQIATVLTHERLRSDEFIKFLEWAKKIDVAVSVVFPKLVGEWVGRTDIAITTDDVKYFHELGKKYNTYDHLTPKYGQDIGCLAVKGIMSITKWGDVMPCPWMYFSIGNFFNEPLSDIIKRGLKYFNKKETKCLVSEDIEFINKYVSKTYTQNIPIPIKEVFGDANEKY